MKFKYYLLIFLFTVICCGQNSDNKSKSGAELQKTEIKTKVNCIKKSDSLQIEHFVSDLINDIMKEDYQSIYNKFENPKEERKIVEKMSEEFPYYFQAVFSKEIIDEDGDSVGFIKGLENAEILYENIGSDCFEVSVGLDTGLIFKVKIIEDRLVIYEYSTVG